MPGKRVYYLAQKYGGIEEEAFLSAVLWTAHLRKSGHTVFSPILHTHAYEIELKTINKRVNPQVDYEEDYVKWDLDVCEAMVSDLTMLFAPSCFKDPTTVTGSHLRRYGPKLHVPEEMWNSKGAFQEYCWAKQRAVPCMLLVEFFYREDRYI
jgi:hypothetical protein